MNIAPYIEHTLLIPTATPNEIMQLCSEAEQFAFAAVCVNPIYVALASHLLKGTKVKVATVIGFPLGSMTTKVKVYETQDAIKNKADEIDMVISLGAAKAGLWTVVEMDIKEVVEAAEGKIVKVILENCYLSEQEKIHACEAALLGGAHFVKTSTGFGPKGAVVEDVVLMHKAVDGKLGIKAAGGIKTHQQALDFIQAGATRIGSSNGRALLG